MHITAESACKMCVNGVGGCAYPLILETFAWVGGLAGCLSAPADELKQAAFANEQKLNFLCKYLSLMDQMS